MSRYAPAARFRPLLLGLAFVALAAARGPLGPAAPPGARARGVIPPPTENRLSADAEEKNAGRRAAWIESMHRAAPGTDWHAIERTNRAGLAERQQALAQARRPIGGSAPGALGDWQELGPDDLTGRNHVTVFNSAYGEFYMGTANGIFRGYPGSNSWTPLGDQLGLPCEGLAVAHNAPDHLVAIGDPGNVHYSPDRGLNWYVPAGLPDAAIWRAIRVLADPTRPFTIYLLLDAWRYTPFEHQHYLLRSLDSGASFTILQIMDPDHRPDIWMSRTGGSGDLYLAQDGEIRQSTNAGLTFTTIGTLPVGGVSEVLAGTEAGAPDLYVAQSDGADWTLYHSADAGVTWNPQSSLPGFWEGSLTASIQTPGLVFYGGIDAYRSTDFGATFAPVNEWYEYYGDPDTKLHADLPGIDCVLVNIATRPGTAQKGGITERWYFDTDGGTFESFDQGVTSYNATRYGFHNAKFYTILTSVHNPYQVAGGSQDQGYDLARPDLVAPPGPFPFTQEISGDYAHLTSTAGDHNMLYSVYPGFILLQVSEGATGVPLQFIDFPPAPAGISFLPFILADRHDPDVLYFGADHLWRMVRDAPDFTYTNTELPQDFSEGAGYYVTALAISPADENYWYLATSGGSLWYSHDAGASWTQSASVGPPSHYFYGSALVCAPTNRNVAWVGGSGYSNPSVFQTTTGGTSWEAMDTGLPPTQVYDLALDAAGRLYAGTENAPYVYDTGTDSWHDILGGVAPLVTYWDLESVPAIGAMRCATYGRGIWDYDTGAVSAVHEPGAGGAGDGAAGPGLALTLAPNPARSASTLAFDLKAAGPLRVEIFDLSGRRAALPLVETRAAGPVRLELDLRNAAGGALANGVYFVRVAAGGAVGVQKLRVLH